MSQPQQLLSHSCHRRDYRHYPATLALCLEDSLRHVTNSFRCSNGSAAIFLNHQAHVEIETNANCDSFRGWLQLNCASHIRYGGGDRLQFFYSPDNDIGVFQTVSSDGANDQAAFPN